MISVFAVDVVGVVKLGVLDGSVDREEELTFDGHLVVARTLADNTVIHETLEDAFRWNAF